MSMPPVNNINNNNHNSECCSENESESSSVNYNYKKPGTIRPRHNPVRYDLEIERTRAIRQSAVTIKRAVSLPRTTIQPTKYIAPMKQINRSNMSNRGEQLSTAAMTMSRVQTRTPKPQKPNSLPHVQSRNCKPNPTVSTPTTHKRTDNTAVRIRSSMLSVELKSVTAQNPYGTVPRRRKQKSVEDLLNGCSLETRSSSVSCDARMTTSMGMGKLVGVGNARKQLQLSYSGMSSNSSSAWTTPTQSHATRWPSVSCAPSRKQQVVTKSQRTRIYYEQSVQTSLTNNDMLKLFNGECTDPGPLIRTTGNFECQNQAIQCTDIRDAELEKLRDEVRSLSMSLQREREEKLLLQSELQLNTERVMSMLEVARINGIGGSGGAGSVDGWTPTSEDDASTGTGSCSVSGHDSLLMLESQIQLSGQELVERQLEVRQLRQLCRSLQTEMQRSVAAQQFLLQEKAAIEEESNELQDFLQHEKTAMYDALRELETDFEECKSQLSQRDEEVKALREKCQYLVRLNEQRRQENLLLQTKFNDFKTKSRNYVAQKQTSLGVAFAVLSKLHARLRSLVDELKLTYNLSEQDLECQSQQCSSLEQAEIAITVEKANVESENGNINNESDKNLFQGIHNSKTTEVVGNGDGKIDKNEDDLSPQRHQTFIAAIISAIRSATTTTTTPSKRALPINQQSNIVTEYDNNVTSSSPFASNGNSQSDCANDMLDLETEPCLMMENVLEDVKIPDTYSHNMVTKQTAAFPPDIELLNVLNTEIVTTDSLSLHNLSQAIVNRQKIDMQSSEDIVNSFFGELLDAGTLIEKVNDVDVLVTRLLRLIQMDNDNCIQQLIVDKNKLQQNREEMLEKIRELQEVNIKLQDDLMDATQELMLKNNDITGKNELQAHANEIDVRF